MKNNLLDFKKFTMNNKKNIITLFVISVLIYSYRMFFINTGIDNEVLTNSFIGARYAWYTIGRWGLNISKYLLYLNKMYNPYYIYILTILFFTMSSILFSYTISKIINKKNEENKIVLIFGLLYLTSPLYAEMFHFTMLSAEVALAFFLISLSFYTSYRYIYIGDNKMGIFSILLLTYSFGSYQAFFPFAILLAVSMFLLELFFDKNLGKKYFKPIIKHIAIFLISFIVYSIISKIITTYLKSSPAYLTNQIMWFKVGFRESINQILDYMVSVFIPFNSVHFNFGYLLFSILAVIISVNNAVRRKKIMELLCVVIVVFSPFIMCIIQGSALPVRTQYMLPFASIILVIYSYFNLKNIKIKSLLLVLTILIGVFQFKATSDLFYSDQVKYEEDKYVLSSIVNEANSKYDLSKKELIFVGIWEPKSTGVEVEGETLARSFFIWDLGGPVSINDRVCAFSKTLGFDYKCATIKNYKKAQKVAKNMDIYPNGNCMKEEENYIVVKLK